MGTNISCYLLPILIIASHHLQIIGVSLEVKGGGYEASGIAFELANVYSSTNNEGVFLTYQVMDQSEAIERLVQNQIEFITAGLYRNVSMLNDLYQSDGGGNDFQLIPFVAQAVVLSYNVPSLSNIKTNLTLDSKTIVGIFNGTITQWNDKNIQQLNPSITLPDERITVFIRTDKSLTTEIFTTALSSFSDNWNLTFGIFSEWDISHTPYDLNYLNMSSESALCSGIQETKYSIGYVSLNAAILFGLTYAGIQNSNDEVIFPSVTSVQTLMTAALNTTNSSFIVHMADNQWNKDPSAYPIADFIFLGYRARNNSDCQEAILLYDFLSWIYGTTGSTIVDDLIEINGYVPITTDLKNRVQNVLNRMECILLLDGVSAAYDASIIILWVLLILLLPMLGTFLLASYWTHRQINEIRKTLDCNPGPEGKLALVFAEISNFRNLKTIYPTIMAEAITAYEKVVSAILKKYNGYPASHEQCWHMIMFKDPINAVLFCNELHTVLLKLNWSTELLQIPECVEITHASSGELIYRGLKSRIGLHFDEPTCSVDVRSRKTTYTGTCIKYTILMQKEALPGTTLMSTAMKKKLFELAEHDSSVRTVIAACTIASAGLFSLSGLEGPEQELFILLPVTLSNRWELGDSVQTESENLNTIVPTVAVQQYYQQQEQEEQACEPLENNIE
jgi:phosphate transport system substrate-binding protein